MASKGKQKAQPVLSDNSDFESDDDPSSGYGESLTAKKPKPANSKPAEQKPKGTLAAVPMLNKTWKEWQFQSIELALEAISAERTPGNGVTSAYQWLTDKRDEKYIAAVHMLPLAKILVPNKLRAAPCPKECWASLVRICEKLAASPIFTDPTQRSFAHIAMHFKGALKLSNTFFTLVVYNYLAASGGVGIYYTAAVPGGILGLQVTHAVSAGNQLYPVIVQVMRSVTRSEVISANFLAILFGLCTTGVNVPLLQCKKMRQFWYSCGGRSLMPVLGVDDDDALAALLLDTNMGKDTDADHRMNQSFSLKIVRQDGKFAVHQQIPRSETSKGLSFGVVPFDTRPEAEAFRAKHSMEMLKRWWATCCAIDDMFYPQHMTYKFQDVFAKYKPSRSLLAEILMRADAEQAVAEAAEAGAGSSSS